MLQKLIIFLFFTILFYLVLYLKPLQFNKFTPLKGKGILLGNVPENFSYIPKTPILDKIFIDNHNWVATISSQKKTTLIATGDIIPARSVNFQVLQRRDFKWPYFKTADIIKDADITFINLESPLIDNCPTTQEGMIFCGNVGNIEGLIYAGVDVATLANNHAGNYGEIGVLATVKQLKLNGIDATGTNFSNLVIKDIRGVKFAFLGFNDISKNQPGIANFDEQILAAEILDAKNKADVVIVAFHWGTEYKNQPDERQKYLGHLAIDSGADLIIGNHPHWIQPVEIYKDKLITYAHGNFIFDQEWSQKTKEGVVGKYTFYDNQLIDVEFLPVEIEDFGQPYFLQGHKRQSILDELEEGSLQVARM